ncbi:2-hydroxyacyl-CoA dehydratase family protein [Novisyntrophococcus fermenticellae]|nr:2-hydroxyacyl-CoA dehydratase family protein [Novisyntrophococcus fermenticellae]
MKGKHAYVGVSYLTAFADIGQLSTRAGAFVEML